MRSVSEPFRNKEAAEAAEQFWSVAETSHSVCPATPDATALRPRIAYVRDSALWFYYEENLEALERAGAELVRLEVVGPNAGQWPVLRGSDPQGAACGENILGIARGFAN